jgi:catechol 2,3-dioxygenase-like lactoylglutathione lyase family enzyme
MFDHVGIGVSDREASERFYTTLLSTLGIEQPYTDDELAEWDDFALSKREAVTRRLHIGFAAPSREHVDAFWRAGTEAGYQDDGAPGPRPQYGEDYYGAFLLDPDGNSAEAVHYGAMRRPGVIDHLWIRVADVAASARFYETAGLQLRTHSPDHVQVLGEHASFSLVTGMPTEHVHIAFPASDDAAVDAFHRTMTEAGYRDNGAPGERPVYHPGYYGAFVLDPDGHNVELVNHNR